MLHGRTRLWQHFTYVYMVGHERYYKCNYCGQIVASNERRRHLRFKHPEIWRELEKPSPPTVGFKKHIWDIGRELAEKKGRFTNREVFRIVEQEMGRELSLGEKRKITGILKRYFHKVKWEEDRKGGKHLRWVYFE